MPIHTGALTGAHHHGALECVQLRSEGEAVAVKLDIEPVATPEGMARIDPTQPAPF